MEPLLQSLVDELKTLVEAMKKLELMKNSRSSMEFGVVVRCVESDR